MFITKRSLPRRTFLKGAGGMLALPLLEAMIPASTALAQTPASPKPRFAGIFFPHGMAPGHWEMPEGPLPEKLSTDRTSLADRQERLAMVIEMTVSADGSIAASDVYRALVEGSEVASEVSGVLAVIHQRQ